MPYIQHQFNGATVSHYELGEQLTIGRAADNHILIDDATVSGHHAVIEKTEAGIQIRDLGSTNGIRVNGEKASSALIHENDVIIIGTHTLCLIEHISDELQKTLKIKKSWIPGVYYTAR